MSWDDAVWLVAAGAASVLLGCFAWGVASRALARRARRLRYQRVSHSRPQRLWTQAGGVSGSMGPERAEAIRRDAESAARLVAGGEVSEILSRHPPGSAEHVLWVATYHLTMTELAEAAQAAAPAPVPDHPDRLSPRP